MASGIHVNQLEATIAAACELIAHGDDAVESIHVATNRRPTWRELMRYREIAQTYCLAMTLLRGREVVLRPRRPGQPLIVDRRPHTDGDGGF